MRHRVVGSFVEGAEWFSALLLGLSADQLEGPGLGEWTLRQLVAHGSRALTTVEEYLRPAPSDQAPGDDAPIAGAAAYFLNTRDNPQLHRDVAERGRREAARLGEAVADEVATMVTRVSRLVRNAPQEAVFETRFGTVGFATYLCTRTVELVVHGIDLCDAARIDAEPPDGAAQVTLEVMAELAHRRGDTAPVISALAGRAPLPAGLSLFS